jgi:lipoprotein-releasing system permease protein
MFHPLPFYIALRYLRSRKQGFFVSFISWISMAGICLGVAALITIVSVMNGFERELRTRLLSLASHATISGTEEQMRDWRSLAARIRSEPDVRGVAPYFELQGLIGRGQDLHPAVIRGVDPAIEPQVSDFNAHMTHGTLADLKPGEQGIVLGAGLAWALDAREGDEITVLVPTGTADGEAGFQLQPRIENFIAKGVFEVGVQEHDNALALVHLQDAEALGSSRVPAGLRVKFKDIFAAPSRIVEIANKLGGNLQTSDWAKENASYFRAVRIEKTMMMLILMLVVAVAAFNIVSALVMVVNEKRTDIAILRTVGISPRAVVAVFVTQGVLIGWIGALIGLALGLSIAFNVDVIVPFLERVFGVQIFDPTVYVITQVPSEVQWPQVVTIAITALVLTIIATIYPAMRGAATQPADALRYE